MKKTIQLSLIVIVTCLFFGTVSFAKNYTYVYRTNTGKKYHSYGCQYLKYSCKRISLVDAAMEGLEPCSVCNPPSMTDDDWDEFVRRYQKAHESTIQKSYATSPPQKEQITQAPTTKSKTSNDLYYFGLSDVFCFFSGLCLGGAAVALGNKKQSEKKNDDSDYIL